MGASLFGVEVLRMGFSLETRIAQSGLDRSELRGAISFPIYLSVTFRRPAIGQSSGFDYARTSNPTRLTLEDAVASLEGGAGACAFSSGMAAITSLFMLFRQGDHVVITEDLYGGTYGLFQQILKPLGIRSTFVDTSDVQQVKDAIRDETVALLVESPTNPLLKIADLRALAGLAKERGLLLVVDNTMMTPYLQRPLELGADVVVHSATKYLGGHNDLLAGIVVCKDPQLFERLKLLHKVVGATLSPHDAWLLLRGIKTLAVRMERHQENAFKIARWLKDHPLVTRVYYPGLPEHPGFELQCSQAGGAGGMIAFSVTSPEIAHKVLENVRLFSFAESLGGVESLITYPKLQTHAHIPAETLDRLGIDDTLLRLSVGIEHADDLIRDLQQALEKAQEQAGASIRAQRVP